MKTASAEYLQRMSDPVAGRAASVRVRYKRRYWNGSAFVYESSYQVLDDSYIEEISPINWKMDTKSQTKILASNLTLRLKNVDWHWVKENVNGGAFAPDGVAVDGYDDYRIRFEVDYGFKLASGSYEYLTLFTGFSDDLVFTTDRLAAEIRVLGREIQLAEANAQEVSTSFVNQATTPATGNGSNLTFTTLKSVWRIDTVRVNGVVKLQGADYTLQNVGDGDAEATIVFVVAPPAGHSVDWSGSQWLRNKTVSQLVEALCDEAGITSGERTISNPEFPGVTQSHIITSQAQWAAGTLVNADTDSVPGDLRRRWFRLDDFDDLELVSSVWAWKSTNPASNNLLTNWTAASGYLAHNGTIPPYPIRANTAGRLRGTWQFECFPVGSNTDVYLWAKFNSGSGAITDGYYLRFNTDTIILNKIVGGVVTALATFATALVANHVYRITISAAGEFRTYQDGVLIAALNATDTTFGLSDGSGDFMVAMSVYTNLNSGRVDSIFYTEVLDTTTTANNSNLYFESPEIDMLSAPTDWLPVLISSIIPLPPAFLAGTRIIRTRTAAISGGPYEAAVAVNASLIPQSTKQRYVKISVEAPAINSTTIPFVTTTSFQDITLQWLSTNFFVGHADFLGKSCMAAVQRIAEIFNMEFGFTGSGNFFFRSKTVNPSSVLEMDQHNYVQGVRSLVRGYDAIKNWITVKYGEYYSEKNAFTEGDASPNSQERFGVRLDSKTINDFLFANNADISGEIAKVIRREMKDPRIRVSVDARIAPALDLGDVVNFGFSDKPQREQNLFGDPQNPDPIFGEDFRMILRKRLFKLLGVNFNVKAGTNNLEMIEVLE